jgi:hypothetical protein
MKKSLPSSIISLWLFTPMISLGGVSPLLLVPDAANSSDNSFGGSLEKTLDDPFEYDANDPTSVLPDQVYNNGSIGYHANLDQDIDAILSYTHTAVSIDADDADLIVDLYGRIDLDCCRDRDDNIDVQIFEGSYDTPIATVTGLMIDNAASGWIRATFDSLPIGTSIDRVRVIGHDSGGGEANNYFTLLEIRSAIITPNVDLDNDGLPDDWEDEHGFSTTDDGSANPANGPDGDPDNDLLSNLEELNNKTDPNDGDSDDDLLKDGEELTGAGSRPATDPLNADTDGDTLSDLVESNTGIFVDASDTGSNPTLADSDSDGTTDDVETANGTNPNDPVSGGNLASGKTGGYFDSTGAPVGSWGGLPATNVNDGVLASISHPADEASTDYYYELDLGADFSISTVVITGRGFRDACCPERLQDQTLVILNSTGAEVFSQAIAGPIVMSEAIDLSAAAPFGQFIRIVNTSGASYAPQLGELAVSGSSVPPAAPLITSLDTDSSSGNVTINWKSQPGATYSIFGSPNLLDFAEVNDSVPSNGTESSFSFVDPEIIGASRYFYYIQKN